MAQERTWTNGRKGKGKREDPIPPQPGAQVGALLSENAHFAVSLQEAFADHYLGTKLHVTEWTTALPRPLDSSTPQWRCSWSSLLNCSASPECTPLSRPHGETRVFPIVFEKGNPIMLEGKTGGFFFTELCNQSLLNVTNCSAWHLSKGRYSYSYFHLAYTDLQGLKQYFSNWITTY